MPDELAPDLGTSPPPGRGTSREYLSPPDLPPANAYTHLVKAGNLLFVSGQVALDAERRLVGPGDVSAQTRQALDNVGRLLAAGRASWSDVVKITIYLTDVRHVEQVREARAAYYEQVGIRPPATTTVAAIALAAPGALIEIEAIAALD
jgi:enamine deaminase RidA (YjgF/YER057c/UK114 family)